MATIVSTPTRFDFIRNPIVYSVRSGTAAAGSSFHRVKFRVPVKVDGVLKKEFILSQSISGTSSEVVEFDISSCFRAIAETYIDTLGPLGEGQSISFARFSASPSAFDVYVKDNEEISNAEVSASEITTHLGGYTDYERLQSSVRTILSRKPSTTEIICPGDIVVHPIFQDDTVTTQSVARVIPATALAGTTLSFDGHKYYVVNHSSGSRLFQFINSRGCIESVRAFGLNVIKLNGDTSSSVISRFERFNSFSRTIVRKHIKPTEIQMSSGPVTFDWAKWWAYEFCQATHIWMLDDNGTWLPCAVTLADNPTIFDHTKTELLSVTFTVTPDLNGPLW